MVDDVFRRAIGEKLRRHVKAEAKQEPVPEPAAEPEQHVQEAETAQAINQTPEEPMAVAWYNIYWNPTGWVVTM